jgi:hypothetical protein
MDLYLLVETWRRDEGENGWTGEGPEEWNDIFTRIWG